MWTFFEDGTFFSAVNHRDEPGMMLIRPRDRNSAEKYAEFCEKMRGAQTPIMETSKADYQYRVMSTKTEWAGYMAKQVAASQATNFKDEVAKNIGYREGGAFLNALHDVWHVMYTYQDRAENVS